MTASSSAILDRLIEPAKPGLSPEAAHTILGLRFGLSDVDRMNELAEKNRRGSLSPEENDEFESYLEIGEFLALLQAKARKSLLHADLVS